MESKNVEGSLRNVPLRFSFNSNANWTRRLVLLGNKKAQVSIEITSAGGNHTGNFHYRLSNSGVATAAEDHTNSPYVVAAGAFVEQIDNLYTTEKYLELEYERVGGSGVISVEVTIAYTQ